MIVRTAILLCLLAFVMSAAPPIPQSVKPRSNPSNAKLKARSGADAAFNQSTFGRDLVNKVKRGAIYIWAMSPDPVAGALGPAWIGSGFIFQAVPEENAAYALTNHHVANNATMLQVETFDRSTYRAETIA